MDWLLALGAVVILSAPIAAGAAWWVKRMAPELTRFMGWRGAPWPLGRDAWPRGVQEEDRSRPWGR